MIFRPFPILTLVAIPAMVALIWLGVWQVERAQWKADLIADFERTSAAEPLPPEAAMCGSGVAAGRVVSPPVAAGEPLRMFGHNAEGLAGWRLFRAATLSCGAVLAETGFEPVETGGQEIVPGATPAAVSRFLIEPWPEKPWMAAENMPSTNEWHWFDAPLIAAQISKQTPAAAPLNAKYILTPLSGLPDFLVRTPPEGHIGYAVTWFGLAIAFLVIYALFHARAGRLRFRPEKNATPG